MTQQRNGRLLHLIRTSPDHEARTVAEAIVPGGTLTEAAQNFDQLLRSASPTADHLLLYAEPGAEMQTGDQLYTGFHLLEITHVGTDCQVGIAWCV